MKHHMIDRRTVRSDQLLAEILKIVEGYLAPDASLRELGNELRGHLYCRGVQVITEYERAQAGLEPRNADGYTLSELQAYENGMTVAMLKPLVATFAADDPNISGVGIMMRERAK